MIIKDLEISKELSGKELSAVRGGGTNIGVQGGVVAAQGGLSFLSGQNIVNAPSQTQTNTEVGINTLTAVQSLLLAAQSA
jgi:hypothetical protein